ncbi:MAG: hypothetical protein AAF208_01570 [Cyanobacteria bacterium P01_A01_bin.45]
MEIEQKEIMISTPDGKMPAFLCVPTENKPNSAVIVLMEFFKNHL